MAERLEHLTSVNISCEDVCRKQSRSGLALRAKPIQLILFLQLGRNLANVSQLEAWGLAVLVEATQCFSIL